jgi:hypothetical protein
MALGGIIGTILSGASNTLGANPLGVALGAGQMITGALQRKKAQAMAPSPVDVGRQRLLNELMRQQKRVLTGTQAAGKDAQQLAKTMQRSAFAAGGAVPNYSGKIISDIMNNIREGEANQVLNLNTQIAQSTGEMEKRKFDLQSLAQSKIEADAALNKKSGFQNLAAAMMPADKEYQDPFGLKQISKKKKKAGEVDLNIDETEEETQG